MALRKQLVEYAISQVGTAENPLGSNKQKYGEMLDKLPWYLRKDSSGKEYIHKVNGHDWCTQFVDAAFIATFSLDEARKMLYRPVMNDYGSVVKYAFDYFKSKGKGYVKEKHIPEPGDVIYFHNTDGLSHTGIVVDVTDTEVITVEGNAGTNSQYVAKKSYKKTNTYIYGYGVPDYGAEPKPDPNYKKGEKYKIVCRDYLNLRTGPGTFYTICGRVLPGNMVICDDVVTDTNYTWLKVNNFYICAKERGDTYIK